ncbi:hypothetical protein [Natronococcus occultus]|uniref:Uncharacterized protein n=1 Tax=Natronococcus occultus SP4 TaxID=694430 RepID=L0JV98_9EURY|nr:hypothetical protein [Natronococcus occultus]AGB36044.1 hypothetical protein Natoc_0164 [Natronococcus occultus SP4]
MTSRSPVFCQVCNETIDTQDSIEPYLVYEHRPRELASRLVSEWEAEGLGSEA